MRNFHLPTSERRSLEACVHNMEGLKSYVISSSFEQSQTKTSRTNLWKIWVRSFSVVKRFSNWAQFQEKLSLLHAEWSRYSCIITANEYWTIYRRPGFFAVVWFGFSPPLQRHNTENSKQIFPEKELSGLSPNYHMHVFVSDLYVYSHDRSAYSAAEKPGLYKSFNTLWQQLSHRLCTKSQICGFSRVDICQFASKSIKMVSAQRIFCVSIWIYEHYIIIIKVVTDSPFLAVVSRSNSDENNSTQQ